MPKAATVADISIKPPGYADDLPLMLARDENGRAMWRRGTISLLPGSRPTGTPGVANFPPEVRVQYEIASGHQGPGQIRFIDGAERVGRALGVETMFQGFFPGPKVYTLVDENFAANGGFETWAAGLPSSWTKIDGAETVAQIAGRSSANAVRVTSAGAGQGLRQTLTHGEFFQCRVRAAAWVMRTGAAGHATLRIRAVNGGTTNYDVLTTGAVDVWEYISITADFTTTTLTGLSIDLIPANGAAADFDDIEFSLVHFTGPASSFAEMGNAAYHASGRTVWKWATGHWRAQSLRGANVKHLILCNDRLYAALGGSNNWEHSTDGSTWNANTLSGDDRYADLFALTTSIFGTPVLWKALLPNKLAASINPTTSGSWATYLIGNSDSDIVDLFVEENVLYIVKEDGLYVLEPDGAATQLTPEWAFMRRTLQGKGGAGWEGYAYVPAGRQSIWEFSPDGTRTDIHPDHVGSDVENYAGKATRVLGAGNYLFAFLQEPFLSIAETCHLLYGHRGHGRDEWHWSHRASIDAGRVDHAWISSLQEANPRLYWAGPQQDTSDPAATASTKAAGAGANRDVGNTDWATPGNILASDEARATWSQAIASTSNGPRSTGTATSVVWTSPSTGWSPLGAIIASDNAYVRASPAPNTATDKLRCTNHGFSIPAAAVIVGVEVKIEWMRDATNPGPVPGYAQLVGVTGGASRLAVSDVPTVEGITTVGGASDMWSGATATGAQVNAAGFGVDIWCVNNTSAVHDIDVDHVQITVWYRLPTTIRDVTVKLLKAGVAAGDNKAITAADWPSAEATQEYGGSADMWGTTLTPAEANANDFGVEIQIKSRDGVTDATSDYIQATGFGHGVPTGATVTGVIVRIERGTDGASPTVTARIDYIEIVIYYTPGAGSELDNKVGWVIMPVTDNPRLSTGVTFATDVTLRTGILGRYPGWKTAWQEVTLISSDKSGEVLGSDGRQFKVKYDLRDGLGFRELGGAGNGTFITSPVQTKYFKSALVSSVVAEEIEVEVEMETGLATTAPYLEKIVVAGTVLPVPVVVYEFTVLLERDFISAKGGRLKTTSAEMLTALRTMGTPGWSTTLYDRDGNAHEVFPLAPDGIVEEDITTVPDESGKVKPVRAVGVRCFEVPNSANWGS